MENITTFFCISIHTPLTRCDYVEQNYAILLVIYIHTPINRCDNFCINYVCVSIHTPLTRCDMFRLQSFGHMSYLYPHTPYGVWEFFLFQLAELCRFQSTHPLRGVTSPYLLIFFISFITIHAPLTECDFPFCNVSYNFYPHTLTGCDMNFWNSLVALAITIHTPLTECENSFYSNLQNYSNFNPHTPYEVWH